MMEYYIKNRKDYNYFLKYFEEYDPKPVQLEGSFTYHELSDDSLSQLRIQHRFDEIAGIGDEITRILNLMSWVHNNIRYDGQSKNPEPKNALNMINICREENRAINCWMLAIVLNEVYLSMGFKSRFIRCAPMGMDYRDCHVINIVYSNTLNKWVAVDPTFEAYYVDAKGNLLNIEELRKHLMDMKDLKLNDNINANGNPVNKEGYLSYMTKNTFRFDCWGESAFNIESEKRDRVKYYLNPANYLPNNEVRTEDFGDYKLLSCYISDPTFFWSLP